MALVDSMNGTSLLVQLGDGADPEVFAHDCLINAARGIQFQSETSRQTIPDCTNPEALAWQSLSKDGLTATINGEGMLHTSSVPDWDAWFSSDDAKNARVLLNGVAAGKGGGHWAGAFKLTGWTINGERRQKATVTVTLESHGPVTWVDAT